MSFLCPIWIITGPVTTPKRVQEAPPRTLEAMSLSHKTMSLAGMKYNYPCCSGPFISISPLCCVMGRKQDITDDAVGPKP